MYFEKKEFIEYNKLTKKQALVIAKERKIKTVDKEGEDLNMTDLIKELKATH